MVHAWVAARRDREASWDFFVRGLHGDVTEVRGGTTAEGIHLGAMAGTIDLSPALLHRSGDCAKTCSSSTRSSPPSWARWPFDIRYRGHLLHLEFTTELARVHVDLAEGAPITVDIKGTAKTVLPGQTLTVSIA